MTSQSQTLPIEIHLAHTQGFCAGVSYAIEIVEQALQKFGAPLYVRHQIVHNTSIVKEFEKKGAIFVEELSEIPEGANVIFSAHGVAPEVYEEAKDRNIRFVDATCPLVTKVHREATKFSKENIQTILIGHRGHQELIGTAGYVNPELLHIVETEEDVDKLELDPAKPKGYLTQTTLSITEATRIIDKLKERYPDMQAPPKKDICYATQNRQDSVRELAKTCDVVIICGSPNSSNSNRLREAAAEENVPSYIIDTAEELNFDWLEGRRRIGISSGASVPTYVVDTLVAHIQSRYPTSTVTQKESIEQDISFRTPKF